MINQSKCRHGIPYGTRCQTCINHVLYWRSRKAKAGGVPGRKIPGSESAPAAADPPAQPEGKP
jgi:hypothetical protein